MKKLVFLIVLFSLLFALSACSENDPEHVPFDQLSFVLESNPDFIGSYSLSKTNELGGTWTEWGEWTPLDFSSRVVCFGAFSINDTGTFRYRSDYEWKEIKDGNSYCLKLEKRQ